MILPGPPVGNGIDLEKLEHQKVVVDFRLTDGLADDTRHYVIQRDKSGSYEVLSTGLIDEDKVWCVCVCVCAYACIKVERLAMVCMLAN